MWVPLDRAGIWKPEKQSYILSLLDSGFFYDIYDNYRILGFKHPKYNKDVPLALARDEGHLASFFKQKVFPTI
jgi:hypothetical protein